MTNTVHTNDPDRGSTLVELLVAILIVGVLASVVVFAVGGMRTSAGETACEIDHRQLAVAAEAYAAVHGISSIEPTGASGDRYEQTLVDGGLLRNASGMHDLDADGALTKETDFEC